MTGEEEAQAWTSPLFSVSEFSAVGKGKKIPLHFVFLMSLGFSPAGFYSLLLASQIRRMLAYFKFHRIRQPLINRKIDVLECYQNMEMESWSGLHPFSLWVQWSYITVGGGRWDGAGRVCAKVYALANSWLPAYCMQRRCFVGIIFHCLLIGELVKSTYLWLGRKQVVTDVLKLWDCQIDSSGIALLVAEPTAFHLPVASQAAR